jgi:predicted ATPase
MLKKLYIHNFKSFYHSHFEFGKLNCIIAPNNTGKSNLIEAIEYIDNLLFRQYDNAIELKRNFKYPEDKDTVFQVEFEIINRVLVLNELIDYKLIIVFDILIGDTYNIDVHISGSIKSINVLEEDKVVDYFNYFMLRSYGDELPSTITNYLEYSEELDKKRYSSFDFTYNHMTFNYILSSNKNQKSTIFNFLGLNLNSTNNIIKPIDFSKFFGRGSIFESHYFHAHLIKEKQIIPKTANLDKYGTNLVAFLNGLSQETLEEISMSLIGEVEQVNGIELSDEAIRKLYFVEDRYKISLEETSDGTVHFVAIISAVLGNKTSMALMIEEPERHMHMKVLSTILETMRCDNKQMFFTTHSTEILQQLKLDEILFMFRDYDGNTKGQRAKDIPNIKKIMKLFKGNLVEMIQTGVLGEYDE